MLSRSTDCGTFCLLGYFFDGHLAKVWEFLCLFVFFGYLFLVATDDIIPVSFIDVFELETFAFVLKSIKS
jgi:hypothetical protein